MSPGAASGEAAVPAPGCFLAAALLGFFVVTLDAVIVSVALPDIRRDPAGGMSGLQWVAAAAMYLQQLRGLSALATGVVFLPMMLTGAVLTPFTPRLAERFGARTLGQTGRRARRCRSG